MITTSTDIANEILSYKMAKNRVTHVIDRYAITSPESNEVFYFELLKALNNNKGYDDCLNKRRPDAIIKSSINGVLLYVNPVATSYQPLIIIGKEGSNVEEMISRLTEEAKRVHEPPYSTCFTNKPHEMIEGAEIFVSINYLSNELDKRIFNLKTAVGNTVEKNDIVAVIEDFSLFHIAEWLKQILAIATKHCNSKIIEFEKQPDKTTQVNNKIISETQINEVKELETQPPVSITQNKNKPKSKKQETKLKTIWEIWDKKQEVAYKKAIAFLLETHTIDERSLSYVTEKEGEYIWHKLVSQKYLAGFIFVCMERGFIENIYSAPELVSICIKTFTNDTLDKNNFTNIPTTDLIKDKHKEPFLNLFSKRK